MHNETLQTTARAGSSVSAGSSLTAPSSSFSDPVARARGEVSAGASVTEQQGPPVPPELLGEIRLAYRAAKSAELARIVIDQKLVSFVRVHLTDWTPGAEPIDREKANEVARRVVEAVRDGETAVEGNEDLCAIAGPMVLAMTGPREQFDSLRADHRKRAERLAKDLPAWQRIGHVKGFSVWGLVALIGEAGDIGAYSGCRKLFKRLGLAPDDCYSKGANGGGRMIPRSTRGRIMGIIADPLLRAQWRGEKDGVPAHAIGPFGKVYGETKARHLEAGKTKGHADKSARRAMVKALIHDVHNAWHGKPLRYSGATPRILSGR